MGQGGLADQDPGERGRAVRWATVGLFVGARLATRYGVGRVIVGSLALGAPFALLVPLAPRSLAVPALIVAQLAAGVRGPIYNVNQISLRQAITPPELLGRMTATMRVLVLGTMPLGALLGGGIASVFGVRIALLLGATVGCAACLFTLLSPVRSLRVGAGGGGGAGDPAATGEVASAVGGPGREGAGERE